MSFPFLLAQCFDLLTIHPFPDYYIFRADVLVYSNLLIWHNFFEKKSWKHQMNFCYAFQSVCWFEAYEILTFSRLDFLCRLILKIMQHTEHKAVATHRSNKVVFYFCHLLAGLICDKANAFVLFLLVFLSNCQINCLHIQW